MKTGIYGYKKFLSLVVVGLLRVGVWAGSDETNIRPTDLIPRLPSYYHLGNANYPWLTATIDELDTPSAGYSRPSLVYVSATTVDVATNTGTANQTCVLFRDGDYRCPVENTASASKYRRFIITETAEFTSGTENSGLRSTYVEATNTWYSLYAVKSQIDSTNFVIVGDTITAVVSNISALNSAYGTDGWVYLGLVRNGDNSGATGNILAFNQSGRHTVFKNTCAGNAINFVGTRLATTASATSLVYTYAEGTGTTSIPPTIKIGWVGVAAQNGAAGIADADWTGAGKIMYGYSTSFLMGNAWGPILQGVSTSSNGAGAHDIVLGGFVDDALTDGAGIF